MLAIVLLIGLVGGVALGAIAAARRTQSSYPKYLANTHPSNLSVIDAPEIIHQISHLRGVTRGESLALLDAVPLAANGTLSKSAAAAADRVFPVGSIDGLWFDQDRATAVLGRMADPKRTDEFVMTADAAHVLGLHVGDRVPMGFYDAKQKLRSRVTEKLVGIVVLNDAVVQDDTERSASYAIFTPALTASLHACCYSQDDIAFTGLSLAGGSRRIATVEREYERLLPSGASFYIRDAAITEAKAERAVKPESIALGVFGCIAALAALLIAGQVVGRQLSADAGDLEVMRALGATPAMTTADALFGVGGAIVLGALLAAISAIGVSPLSPIGPVRKVYPSRGVALDWTVLGFGVIVLIAGLSTFAVVLAYRGTPRRVAARAARTVRRSNVASAAAGSGFGVPAVTGVRFAFESGRGRNAVPVRSAMLGTTLAIIVVAGTVTFGASLRTLVSHPALYGWNWNYELETGAGGGFIPQPKATTLLARDRTVQAWTAVYFDSLRIDQLTVPIIGEQPDAAVAPPVLSGHAFDGANQIVLGQTTLAALHKHVGDTVEASYASCVRASAECSGTRVRTRLRIVGTATMPAVGPALGLHVSMGTGAIVSDDFLPRDLRVQGANALFVRLRNGASTGASLTALRRVASGLSTPGNAVSVLSVQRPAEIVNYRSMGDTPVLLGTALAIGAVSALGLTLVASVRRRRRDLALLKTLGFTRRQLAAVVSWQSTIAVAIGVIVGTPVGIVAGRTFWNLFAREIDAVPHPTVPALTVALIALGALVLANAVAAIPGRQAARTHTAVLLREE